MILYFQVFVSEAGCWPTSLRRYCLYRIRIKALVRYGMNVISLTASLQNRTPEIITPLAMVLSLLTPWPIKLSKDQSYSLVYPMVERNIRCPKMSMGNAVFRCSTLLTCNTVHTWNTNVMLWARTHWRKTLSEIFIWLTRRQTPETYNQSQKGMPGQGSYSQNHRNERLFWYAKSIREFAWGFYHAPAVV